MSNKLALATLLALLPSIAQAQAPTQHSSPYAGEESRAIKSLSTEDIEELRRGGGWGLARTAELNGVPGPAHLLELQDEIPLDPGQIEALGQMLKAMRIEAIEEGERLIAQEAALEAAFRDGVMTEASLRTLLDEIAATRGRLRFIHLRTHLETPQLLREAQIERYNQLRGYAADPGAANPCDSVPAGHDPAMWRRHRGCD